MGADISSHASRAAGGSHLPLVPAARRAPPRDVVRTVMCVVRPTASHTSFLLQLSSSRGPAGRRDPRTEAPERLLSRSRCSLSADLCGGLGEGWVGRERSRPRVCSLKCMSATAVWRGADRKDTYMYVSRGLVDLETQVVSFILLRGRVTVASAEPRALTVQ